MKKLIVIAALIIFIFKVLDLTNTEYNDSSQIQPNTQKSTPPATKEITIPAQEHEIQKMKPKLKSMTKPKMKPKPIKQKRIKYKCDRRKYCSQMRSYEEAKYFLDHCRGVKMDGDRDGIPCERQFGRH